MSDGKARPSTRTLITGASSGIGLELAKRFARDGHDLVLVARSEGKLRELAKELQDRHGIQARVIPADLADPAAPERIFRTTEDEGLRIDFLVNNAGFGLRGPFLETSVEREMEMIQVNVLALTHLTKLYLPGMTVRGAGRILNVASTAAFAPGPLMAVYYATKAYVLSFSEAIANEMKGTGVSVTALCPGPTRTEFQDTAEVGNTQLFRAGVMDAATVAEVGYEAMKEGKVVAIPGMQNRLLAESIRFMPRAAVRKITRAIMEERR